MRGEYERQQFRNFYRCYNDACRHEWQDIWPAQPDDDCPKCGTRHCSPYRSEEVGAETDRHFLLIVEGDAHPRLRGPYGDSAELLAAAQGYRVSDPDMSDGLYWLTVDAAGNPTISAFVNINAVSAT